MNIASKYSAETLSAFAQNYGDLFQLLLLYAEENEKHQSEIKNDIDEIKKTTNAINNKVDAILEKIGGLEQAFLDLKNENRDIEQKIVLMTSKLSKLEFNDDDLDDYYAMSQSVYSNWEEFDSLTKQFIPLAEYLYSKLQKYEKTDYSPVILELCRAIENEFLIKIFRKYTLDLVSRKEGKIDDFLMVDRASYELKDKTGQFVKVVSKASKNKKPEYTLGQMNTILSFVGDSSLVKKSPLLKDFQEYLKKNTEAKRLLDINYTKKINDIVNKYRNPSAHPEFMTMEKANECREIMPERLDYLIDCIAR